LRFREAFPVRGYRLRADFERRETLEHFPLVLFGETALQLARVHQLIAFTSTEVDAIEFLILLSPADNDKRIGCRQGTLIQYGLRSDT